MTQRYVRRWLLCSIAVLAAASAVAGATLDASAEQPAPLRSVGVILGGFSVDSKEAQQFRVGLHDAGYVEGRDVVIEWRSAAGDYTRVPALVSDLLQRKVDVIVVTGTPAAQAVKRATSTVPVVMAVVADPVGSGLVPNLAHPGGNITGLSMMTSELSAKRLELLKQTLPRLNRVAVLWNPSTPFHTDVIKDLKAAAASLEIELSLVSARAPEDLEAAFAATNRSHAHALYVIEDTLFFTHRAELIKLGTKARLPIIYGYRVFTDEGGLISYGPNFGDLLRRSAGYADRILKGASPGELPIEQPTKFELVVNLKTARALGLTIPESVLLRADELIR